MDAHTLTPAAQLATKAKTPFPGESDAYRKARVALLEDEIEFRRHMTRLAEQRRALPPGPVITKDYRFKDANGGEVGLTDLFGDHDALVTYFWMYGPQRERPCPMCTNWLGRRERQRRRHQAACRAQDPRPQPRRAAAGVRGRARLAGSRFRADGRAMITPTISA